MVRLSELVTATVTTMAEDDFGTRVSTIAATFQFYANVREKQSNRLADDGKRRNVQMIEIIARSSDIAALSIDNKLRIDGVDRNYIVMDIFGADLQDRGIDSPFKSYSKIIAKYTE